MSKSCYWGKDEVAINMRLIKGIITWLVCFFTLQYLVNTTGHYTYHNDELRLLNITSCQFAHRYVFSYTENT